MKTAIFLLLPATALLYIPLYLEEFETPKAIALVAFASFALWFVNWRQVLRDKVAMGLLAVTLSAAASTLISMDKQMSVFGNFRCPCGLLVYVSYLVLYLASDAVKDHAETVFDIVIGLSVLVSGYALSQVSGHDFKVWYGVLNSNGYIRPMSFLGHPNFMAEYLAVTLPLILWRIDQNWRGLYRFGYGVAAIMSGAAIFFAQSRGMWLATLAGIAVYFALSKRKPRQILKTAVVAVGIMGLSLAVVPILRHTAAERLERIVTLEPGRQEYLRAAIRIWERSPILGVGTDAFELGFQHQRTPYYWEIEASGSPHKAHNDFLNTLATQGIVGALAAILLTIAALFRCQHSKRPYKAPLIAAIAAFYVGGLSSFTVIAVGCLFVIFLSLLRNDPNENSH